MGTASAQQKSNTTKRSASPRAVQLNDFRSRLQTELASRIQRHPKYSLRSFATFLGLSPSFLSKLLNGKRPFTPAMLDQIGTKLAFSKAEIESYKAAARGSTPSSHYEVAFKRLELDQFSFISDWYHFAILELLAIPDADTSPRGIAKEFGISTHEAADAVERLLRLGFLERDAKGRLANKSGNHTTIGPLISTPATRRQQKQILEKSIAALETIPFEERSQTSLTLAIPRAKLDEARKTIATFRKTMTSLLQDPNDDPDSVYQLSVSFFPLTSLERRSK